MTDDPYDMTGINLSAVARAQGISRAAVSYRASRGNWTREEILKGYRGNSPDERVPARTKNYDAFGGLSPKEVADYNNLTPSGLYYRVRNGLPIQLPRDPSKEKNSATARAKAEASAGAE